MPTAIVCAAFPAQSSLPLPVFRKHNYGALRWWDRHERVLEDAYMETVLQYAALLLRGQKCAWPRFVAAVACTYGK